jgi:hypothetical protein
MYVLYMVYGMITARTQISKFSNFSATEPALIASPLTFRLFRSGDYWLFSKATNVKHERHPGFRHPSLSFLPPACSFTRKLSSFSSHSFRFPFYSTTTMVLTRSLLSSTILAVTLSSPLVAAGQIQKDGLVLSSDAPDHLSAVKQIFTESYDAYKWVLESVF